MNSAIDPRGAAKPKLPLWDTICLAYSTYFRNFSDVLRISWLWLAVVAPLTGMASWMQLSWMAEAIAGLKPGMPPQQLHALQASRPIATLVLQNVAALVSILAFISIAVAWHRRIILGEHPGLSGSNVATKDLWRYVRVGLAICLIFIVPVLAIVLSVLYLLSPLAPGGPPARPSWAFLLIPLIVLIYLTLMVVVLRLSLLLPARAVGDLGLTFAATWKRTRGNTWRIFWGIVACTLPAMLAAQIAFLGLGLHALSSPNMLGGGAFVGPMAVGSTIFTVYSLLIFPIWIGFLSIAYRHFFERT